MQGRAQLYLKAETKKQISIERSVIIATNSKTCSSTVTSSRAAIFNIARGDCLVTHFSGETLFSGDTTMAAVVVVAAVAAAEIILIYTKMNSVAEKWHEYY